jgi:hypothetical protein
MLCAKAFMRDCDFFTAPTVVRTQRKSPLLETGYNISTLFSKTLQEQQPNSNKKALQT